MIAITCSKCKKEFKASGADVDARRVAGVKWVCQECLLSPAKMAAKPKKSAKAVKK